MLSKNEPEPYCSFYASSNKEADQIEEFNKMYGDVLPSYINEPIKFMYYWNIIYAKYKYDT